MDEGSKTMHTITFAILLQFADVETMFEKQDNINKIS